MELENEKRIKIEFNLNAYAAKAIWVVAVCWMIRAEISCTEKVSISNDEVQMKKIELEMDYK